MQPLSQMPIHYLIISNHESDWLQSKEIIVSTFYPYGIIKDESLTILYQNSGILCEIEFQTSFKHSRIIFFKKLWIGKSFKIRINYISKFFFVISSLQKKFINKIQRGCLKMSKENVPSNPFMNFVHNFCLQSWNHK